MEHFPLSAPAFKGNSRVVAAGNAFDWLRQGWALFVVKPGIWVAMIVMLLVLVLGLITTAARVVTLAMLPLAPLLGAGLLAACEKADSGRMPEIADLFAGFKKNTGNLVMLGVLHMAAMLVIFVFVMVLGGGGVIGGILLALLLALALSVPLLMALWFAPALVFFNNMRPLAALQASFNACLKNTVPFLVYGLIVMVLMFFAALPVLLGLLVLVPVLAGSIHASYRDIFVAN